MGHFCVISLSDTDAVKRKDDTLLPVWAGRGELGKIKELVVTCGEARVLVLRKS